MLHLTFTQRTSDVGKFLEMECAFVNWPAFAKSHAVDAVPVKTPTSNAEERTRFSVLLMAWSTGTQFSECGPSAGWKMVTDLLLQLFRVLSWSVLKYTSPFTVSGQR